MAITVVLTCIFLETISTSKDYLTGLLSRHRIDNYLDYMLEHKKSFILVLIDLNYFKNINDNFDHLLGDAALCAFSESLLRQFKEVKVVGRYAGDEFVLILDKMESAEMQERLIKVKQEMKKLYCTGEFNFLIDFSYAIMNIRQKIR